MDIKDYISSEILESYIVGTISDEDRRRIERNLGRYPELRQELRRIEGVRRTGIRDTFESPVANARAALTGKSVHTAPVARVRNLNPENSVVFWRIVAAAAVCLALLTCYFVVDFRSRLGASQEALQQELTRNQELAEELMVYRERDDRVSGTLALFDDLTYTRVSLSGIVNGFDAGVTVFWDRRRSQVFLNIQNLPSPPEGKQYQLWALESEQTTSAGTFTAGSEIIRMEDISNASAFVVTIEPEGGSLTPDFSSQVLVAKTGM